MQFEVYPRSPRIILIAALAAVSLLLCGSAFADSCGVLPFTPGRAVNQGAADNITSLVSSEVDIRGGFGLVLTAAADELPKGCTSKSSCIIDFGKEEGYERLVTGKVDGLGSAKYRITATLWDVAAGRSLREVEHEMERSAGVLVMAIPDLVVELLTGASPQDDEEGTSDAVGSFAEADFDEEDTDTDTDNDTKWMARDRHGRKIHQDGAREGALDGLDDLDDLNLDDMTEESVQKKASKQDERREREAKRRAEEKQLEELAREEQRRRNEQRRRAEAEDRERDEQRNAEREEARRESERADAKRAERQQREALRQEEREEAREKERRAAARQERKRELDRERDRERELDRERDRERELEREKEQRQAYAERSDEDPYEDYELEDDEEVIEIESTISLGGGLVLVEDDQDDDYFGSEEEEETEELRPGDIVEYKGGDYSRRAVVTDEDDSYDNRRRDDNQVSYGSRGGSGNDLETRDIDLDSDDGPTTKRDGNTVNFDRANSGVSSASSARAKTSRRGGNSRRDGPFMSIKAGAGWTAYYPETLSLGMFDYGFEASFFPLPWLSVDVGANFWSVSLIEYDEEGNDLRTVRTLPSFLFGATWHGTFHKVLRPYIGIDLGALLYAQAVVEDGDSTQIRPLFAPLVAADLGIDFIIIPNFGLYVGAKLGVSYAARVQETVNASWNPTTGLAEVWAGALVQF